MNYPDRQQGLGRNDGEQYAAALRELKDFIDQNSRSRPSPEITIILTPPAPKTAKRSTLASYGSYSMPLARRERQQSEEPLSPPSTSSAPISPSPPERLQTKALPRGILPLCHSSIDKCESATNNCSGHGTPYKKSSGAIPCYACRCGKTSITNSDGKVKSVHWGGPACQKKDVSMPFFLLAGITIGLVATASWGVGLMAGIGQEDLPSVIGAGVTGPRAQK